MNHTLRLWALQRSHLNVYKYAIYALQTVEQTLTLVCRDAQASVVVYICTPYQTQMRSGCKSAKLGRTINERRSTKDADVSPMIVEGTPWILP
jgi:hypothetical protein